MKNILVFPCGSEIGLELHRCLADSAHFRLFGASSVWDHGAFVYAGYVQIDARVDDEGFLAELNRTVTDLEIDYILPAHDSVIVALAAFQRDGLLAAEAVVPDKEVADLCRSKKRTYAFFKDVLPLPRLYSDAPLDRAEYPLFAKPDVGQGSKGAALIRDAEAARERLRTMPDSLLMEYLPGKEYTVDCFTDKQGQLRFLSGRERVRIANGISVGSRTVEQPLFGKLGELINSRLDLRGAWFFQLREDGSGNAKLLEIAPRIAGTSGLQRGKGVNLALLTLYDRMGIEINIIENPVGMVEYDRALGGAFGLELEYETAYIDYDDTLIRADGSVDPDLVRFIIQCVNQKKRVVLISRHKGDLKQDLIDRRLLSLFDEVVAIPDRSPKSGYIKEKQAILIDDSFAERAEANAALGIAVFDPSSVEALIDWRK